MRYFTHLYKVYMKTMLCFHDLIHMILYEIQLKTAKQTLSTLVLSFSESKTISLEQQLPKYVYMFPKIISLDLYCYVESVDTLM